MFCWLFGPGVLSVAKRLGGTKLFAVYSGDLLIPSRKAFLFNLGLLAELYGEITPYRRYVGG
jgi:hypothetical protein